MAKSSKRDQLQSLYKETAKRKSNMTAPKMDERVKPKQVKSLSNIPFVKERFGEPHDSYSVVLKSNAPQGSGFKKRKR